MKTFYNPNEFHKKKKSIIDEEPEEKPEENEEEDNKEIKKEKFSPKQQKKAPPPDDDDVDFESAEDNKNNKNTQKESQKETQKDLNTQKEYNLLENNFTNLKISDNKKIENVSFDIKDNENFPRPETSIIFREVEQPDDEDIDFSKAQSDSRYIRSTVQCIPQTPTLQAQWPLPIGFVCRPFAPHKKEIPLVNFKTAGVIRCAKCRAYINPFVIFIDDGRRWQCNFCKVLNQVPHDYYCQLDKSGKRKDISERPELLNGTCEYIAPKEYMERSPQPPSFFFLIDVSKPAVESGLLDVVTTSILSTLDKFPGDDRTKIGFITFDDTIHFYNLKNTLKQPQILVIGELEDTLLPSPHGLLVDLADSKQLIISLLKSLPKLYANTKKPSNCLGPAARAAGRVLGVVGGRISIFISSLPSLGPNALTNREEESVKNEKINVFLPASEFYKELALLYCKDKICCDIFATPNDYIDISTIGALTQYTSGNLYYYPGFKSDTAGEKLSFDLCHTITRETGLEAVMKIRVSNGLNINSYHGNSFIRNSNLLSFPNIDEDSVIDVCVGHSGMGINTANACIQTAVLYTTTSGERRIRVHNLTLPITSKINDLYDHCDINSTMSLISKMAVDNIYKNGVNATKQVLKDYVLNISKFFKNTKELTLPKNLTLLPIYICGLSNSYALSSDKNLRIDQRVSNIHQIRSITITKLLISLHPVLYSISDTTDFNTPLILPLSYSHLKNDQLYLMNTGEYLYLWIGADADENVYKHLKEALENLSDDSINLSEENKLGVILVGVVNKIRSKFGFLSIKIIKQKNVHEKLFKDKLIEDKNYNSFGYSDFLFFLQSEQNKF